jgi:ribosomal-protein-alanine N-acetyltransferase
MVEPFRIRPTAPADLAALVHLEGSAFSDPWTARMLEEALVAVGAVNFVALAEERVAGSIMARQVAGEGEILTIAVEPGLRRRGVGRSLLNAAIDAMASHGTHTVWLEVRESNTAARVMYLGAGFVAAGVRRGYYRRPTEDAVILKREIAASLSTAPP